jgi:2-methylcitrate dehydratase PrpD
MAHGGATVGSRIEVGYQAAYGAPWAVPGEDPAIADNWIKAYPCCLQTHSSIEAAAALGVQGADLAGSGVVSVHPRSRQAAPFDDVTTGMEAKFSIPYTVAYTIISGPPGVADFAKVDEAARALAGRITVRLDERLAQPEAIVEWRGAGGSLEARVEAAKGSPQRPMSDADLDAKVRALAGERLDGILDDPTRPAAEVLEVVMGG